MGKAGAGFPRGRAVLPGERLHGGWLFSTRVTSSRAIASREARSSALARSSDSS